MKRNFQIGVFVTEEEYKRLKEAAGLEPLSSYCRRVLLYHKTVGVEPRRAGTGDSVHRPRPDQGETPRAEMPTTPKPTNSRFCAHGVLKSEHNCRQCEMDEGTKEWQARLPKGDVRR
jgi:hypothetical protein